MSGIQFRADQFLRMYRILEGMLEKRFVGEPQSVSVVMKYIQDADSEPFRRELNICREIRNLLTHNADAQGRPLVEPSEAVIDMLQKILDHVSAPRQALDYGTPREQILCAHPNDKAIDIMRRMTKQGFSHVPIIEKGRMCGVFSVGSLFLYLEREGLDALTNATRISQIDDAMTLDRHGSEKYLFVPASATIYQVREAFEARGQRNSRLSAVFITKNGFEDGTLIAMLTPWDVLKNSTNMIEQGE